MNYDIPSDAEAILKQLNASGYEAYLVGGCVRDLLRGCTPHDWDICTSAHPEQVKACFPSSRIIETGLKHGTVTIMGGNEGYEVTTYRSDGAYTDGRRPDGVQFISSLTADLSRRDFTMNAIAMDCNGHIRDPFDGAADIRDRVVRCVGIPTERFGEDGLRILRAIRFASTFGFQIEQTTSDAVHRQREMLTHVAAERVQSELNKLMVGPDAEAMLLEYLDVLSVFWPELNTMAGLEQHNPWHCYDVWEHTVHAVEHAPVDLPLRLTMLLHDIGKPQCFTLDERGVGHFYGHPAISAGIAEQMMTRLRYDNHTKRQVVELIANHDSELAPRRRIIRRWLNRLGQERFFQLLSVKRADNLAQRPDKVAARLKELQAIEELARNIIEEQQCFTLKDLAVNGRDVIAAGATPGPEVGLALNHLMDLVIDGRLPNEREILLQEIGVVICQH